MAIAKFGSFTSDKPKTPTLKQFIKQNNGSCPQQSNVKILFPPGKYDQYSLITDHDFRVSVSSLSDVYRILEENIDTWIYNQATLVVVIEDKEKALWSLGIDTDLNSSYESFDWGLKLSLLTKKKQETKKNRAPKAKAPDDGGVNLQTDLS